MPPEPVPSKSSFVRRLPPMWWIKRRMRLSRLGGRWYAEYHWASEGWGVTDDTRDAAAQGLLDYIRGVKDGSILRDYYRTRAGE